MRAAAIKWKPRILWHNPLIAVRGAEAPAVLAEMATASAGRSWPVLLGSPDELDMLAQDMSPDVSTEQYHYAPGIVEQGTATISRLAAILLVSDFWYFWWD